MGAGRRALRTLTALAVAVTPVAFGASAHAEGPVTITPSGPVSVKATAGRASATSWADFSITDTSNTAAFLNVCYINPDGKARECDTVRLAPSNYYDGNPQVTGGPGAYHYRARIAYRSMSKDECWTSYFSKQPYRITVSVRNAADVELASAVHPYKVACTGIAGATSGPKRLVVYSGRSSAKAVLSYYLLDTSHQATSIRTCNYDAVSDRYYGCERERMPKGWRTSYGWAFTYTRTWGPMGSSTCALIKRRWPEVGTRIDFYDDNLRKLNTLYRGFHLECG